MMLRDVIELDLSTKSGSVRLSARFQYDRGLKVRLRNVPDHHDYSLEICNVGDTKIRYEFSYNGEDIEIPMDILLDGRDVQLYVYAKGPGWGRTVFDAVIMISRRPSR